MEKNLHPASPKIAESANAVTKGLRIAEPAAAEKNSMPMANPLLEGGFLSATRLKSKGLTTPSPTPFNVRPSITNQKEFATPHTTSPPPQRMHPQQMSRGRDTRSVMKAAGSPK